MLGQACLCDHAPLQRSKPACSPSACQRLPSVCACRQASAPFRLVRSRILDQDRATGQPIRAESKHMVPTWRHSLLALHRLSSRRRMAKHWSSRGSVLVADAAAAVPYSLGGLPVAAGEQDLSSFGQNLLHLLHPAVGAAQSWQVISLPVANATSSRHRKRTSTYSVTCCMYWYTCGWTARLPPPPGRE